MSATASKGKKSGPLAGVKIVDATFVLMGPYCTQVLADLGAEVIKIETHFGDTTRYLPPAAKPNCGGMFMNVNRGKKGIVLDLKRPEGRDILLRLVRRADVFVHSMRAQAIQRLGLTYDDLRSVREDIVYANLYGFGRDGPYADLPAYDDVIQAASGLSMLQARLQNGEPSYLATAIADKVGALTGAYSIIAALFSRSRTGQGQEIEVPMFETMAAFVLTEHMNGAIFNPPLGEPIYKRVVSPDRKPYRTKDGYIAVMIYNDKQWRSFFDILGNPDWSREACFADMTARTREIDRVYGKLAEVLMERNTGEWLTVLRKAEIPAMELYTTTQLAADPHLEAVGFWHEAEDQGGSFRYPGIPTKFSRTPPSIAHAAPDHGENSREILQELGLAESEIEMLFAKDIVSENPVHDLDHPPHSSHAISSMDYVRSELDKS